jgi:tRNA modification GTPase
MDLRNLSKNDTIVACATAPGMGAIAVIRVSGPTSIAATQKLFKSAGKNKKLSDCDTHTAHFGAIVDGNEIVDEVLITLFHEGKSFTGEETVEISCHGSTYITQAIVQLFVANGIRPADAGEFTMRAHRNGKFDLAQAEAIADLIHSTSKANSQLAMNQLRGGISSKIENLREQLMSFAGLIELELDFSEEDVEFADRTQFVELITTIETLLVKLMDSFALGNAIKNGVPVVIVGEPNVGKSTLLNALLNDDRAIVSSIAGTTRDTIEDEINLNGISFRFIDTAGIRETDDEIESKGIEKTFEKIEQAQIVLQLFDGSTASLKQIQDQAQELTKKFPDKNILTIINKSDTLPQDRSSIEFDDDVLFISAKEKTGVKELENKLSSFIDTGKITSGDIIITNARHHASLSDANTSLTNVISAMQNGTPGDLLAIDIRAALHSLGEITGQITTDDLLGHIFSKFCIGK